MSLNRNAVQRVFDFIRRRKIAYQLTFTQPAGQQVLMDLMGFCRANESTFHENERISSRLDGRREVWLRIQQHLNLTPDQLLALYNGNQFQVVTESDEDD